VTHSRLFLPAAILVAAACSDHVTEPPAPPVTVVTVDAPVLALGDLALPTVRVSVDGVSRVAVPSEYAVSSSDPAIVEVTAQGFLAARREGTATVTVGMTQLPATLVERTVTVTPAEFVSLRMTVPSLLIPGDSATPTFSGLTRRGATITDPSRVTVASRGTALRVANAALVVAADTGVLWLVATTPDGAADSARITIVLGAPVGLSIAPRAATLEIGDTVRATSALVDRRLNRLDLPVQYTSSNATVATVNAAGIVVARQGGTALLIASHGSLADTLVAVVNGPAAPAPPETPPSPPPAPPENTPGVTVVTPPGAFVQVRISGAPSASVITAFTNAAARLNGLLRSNSGAFPVPLVIPAGACFETQPAIDETVDGLLITASVGPIDGPGSVLGMAGPCLVRTGSRGIPVLGIMAFDEADMQLMATNGILGGVVLHEMLHVLGIGTLWGPAWQGWVADPGGANPRFTGLTAAGRYSLLDAIDGASGVPVENTGGAGTRGGHWRESIFQTELMTGWAGGAMALSSVTVGALADMGYDVDITRADPYTLPTGLSGVMERGVEIDDRPIVPIGRVDRTGKVGR
jgi:hypothetical protein